MRFSSACGCLMVSAIGACSPFALRMSIQSAWFIRSAEGNQGQRLSPRFAWGESLLAVDPKGTKRSCAHDLAGLRPVPGVAPVGTAGHALTRSADAPLRQACPERLRSALRASGECPGHERQGTGHVRPGRRTGFMRDAQTACSFSLALLRSARPR